MPDTEIEIQINLEHSKPLLEFLKKNAEFKKQTHQIDKYFTPAHRNFIETRPAKEWLRLRNADDKYSINYKNWHHDENGKSHHCDEYESNIENLDSLEKIFNALNIKPLITVDKLRKIWHYKNYEISIDTVKGLGDFVEIEYLGNENKNPEQITDKMIKFLKSIGCGTIKRNYQGYPFLLLFPNEAKYEEL